MFPYVIYNQNMLYTCVYTSICTYIYTDTWIFAKKLKSHHAHFLMSSSLTNTAIPTDARSCAWALLKCLLLSDLVFVLGMLGVMVKYSSLNYGCNKSNNIRKGIIN